jgi:hypothetical protein
MAKIYNVMIMGASYGSLLSTKVLLAGHTVTMVCLPEEADLINKEGTRVRMPVRGHEGLLEIDSRDVPGKLSGATTDAVNPSDYDLIALAMQEPQYGAPGVRELLDAVAKSRVPCMSIMNMPPLPFLKRIPGLDTDALKKCYTDHTVWDSFDPATITLCSPDPQAFRPPEEPLNVLQVTLPTNFKAARFESDAHTAMLREIQADIEGLRVDVGGGKLDLPVKLKVHDSIFVPLAKWSMLLAGNYRCIQANEMRSINDAVHSDLEQTRAVYEWISDLSRSFGASEADQVPFEKYANAATSLQKPSSAARALLAGAKNIERVDCIAKTLAAQQGKQSDAIDEIVVLVESWLARNRAAG